jgi:cell division protease FtsH|tara:strand:- start:555 stop:716 length:162 start_codon:yes stop_codon:yes gene_type:complete
MEAIDAKVKDILQESYQVAIKLIKENKELHEKITQDLLEKEEITEEEFEAYFS